MSGIRCGWLAVAILSAGCASEGKAPTPRVVSLSEFAGAAPAADPTPATAEQHALGAGNEPESTGAPEQVGAIVAGQYIAESLVGQVNGRPIYADEFFEPIEDELIALSERLPPDEFVTKTIEVVQTNLQLVVLNELFLAEAEAGLSAQEQQGILFWLRDLRERIISRSGGVESATQAQLQSEEGLSLDEFVGETKKRALIAQLLEEKIAPRIIVSWRDIEREYERNYDEFNPPSNVTLARIRLSTERDAERIEEVRARLAAGEAFSKIAGDLDQWDDGEWRVFELGPQGMAGIELGEPARGHLADLQVGGTTPAFEVGQSTMWLHVTSIDQPQGRSLYDPQVQRLLAQQLYMRRSAQERAKYIASLLDQGIYDELDEMVDRLVVIALRRYAQTG